MKRLVLPLGGAVAATTMIGATLAGTAGATTAPAKKLVTMASASQAQKISEYWTANGGAKFKAATQYTNNSETSGKIKLGGGDAAPDGKAGVVPPIGGEPKVTAKVKNINLPKTIGKVFFVADGNLYWCSASSIQSKYHNLVATAGHCVFDESITNGALDYWVFVPGYYQGKAPWGVYVGKAAYTHYDFAVYEDFDSDYAFVTVYNGLTFGGVKQVDKATYDKWQSLKYTKGENYYVVLFKDAGRLGDNVGGQGFTWNQKPGQPVYIFGYPASAHPDGDKPFTGVTPKWCYGKTFAAAPAAAFKAEAQIGLKCSMTAGSSGAPWILKYSNTKRLGYINGVSSLIGDADGNGRIDFSTSPYFDSETYAIYKSAANLWSGSLVTSDGDLVKKA
ncbi:hypothetical protein DQ384_07760 [Sphaerisporangium album]|uniref:Serine protease n=1 Tax=Sphaerisporangium album TaxID=509200 RepID=A0A367FRG9_9ACTN|nr:hypothetical protein DQ384_07760 [Sphaerisporangium album]